MNRFCLALLALLALSLVAGCEVFSGGYAGAAECVDDGISFVALVPGGPSSPPDFLLWIDPEGEDARTVAAEWDADDGWTVFCPGPGVISYASADQ